MGGVSREQSGLRPQDDGRGKWDRDAKRLCGHPTSRGTTCRRIAGHGTDHVGSGFCSRHSGTSGPLRTHAWREYARRKAAELGEADPTQLDPAESLLFLGSSAVEVFAGLRAMLDEGLDPSAAARLMADQGENDNENPYHLAAILREMRAWGQMAAAVNRQAIDAGVQLSIEQRRRQASAEHAELFGAVADRLGISRERMGEALRLVLADGGELEKRGGGVLDDNGNHSHLVES